MTWHYGAHLWELHWKMLWTVEWQSTITQCNQVCTANSAAESFKKTLSLKAMQPWQLWQLAVFKPEGLAFVQHATKYRGRRKEFLSEVNLGWRWCVGCGRHHLGKEGSGVCVVHGHGHKNGSPKREQQGQMWAKHRETLGSDLFGSNDRLTDLPLIAFLSGSVREII